MKPKLQAAFENARRAFEAGELEAARGLCELVIKGDRKNARALYLMGCIEHSRQRFDEAVAYLERCAKLAPDEVDVQTLLGTALSDIGRYKPALRHFDKALALRPGWAEALGGKAQVFDRMGDRDRLRSLVGPHVERGDESPRMAYCYARLLAREDRRPEAIELIRKHVDSAETPKKMRRTLLFLMAKTHEQMEQYDESFAACERANRETPYPYGEQAYRDRVAELMEIFSRERVSALPRATHGSELPVLIVGMPRCGSTLVERIIDSHPLAHGAGESLALLEMLESFAERIGSSTPYPRCVTELDQEGVDRAGRSYLSAVQRLAPGRKRVVDKQLLNYENLGLLALIAPEARVIDCRRNPLDTCLSCYMEPLHPQTLAYAASLSHLGSRYREYERLMEHWEGTLDLRMLRVAYEDLIDDQEATSRTIIEFLGLPWDENCLRYHEVGREALTLSWEQVRRPIYRTSVGRAERFSSHLGELRRALGEST